MSEKKIQKRLDRQRENDAALALAEYADTADIGGDPLVIDMASTIRALVMRDAPASSPQTHEQEQP